MRRFSDLANGGQPCCLPCYLEAGLDPMALGHPELQGPGRCWSCEEGRAAGCRCGQCEYRPAVPAPLPLRQIGMRPAVAFVWGGGDAQV
jgi:hypothetical protein